MVHPLFVDFFYTLWGKVIIYLLFMVIPLLLHIKTEHTNWRRPISTTLLLSLWIFVGIFERDISDCSWLVWCWMISSLVLGMFSTFLMGPLFVEERYVNRPGIYWVSSIFSASIITSIYIVGSDSIWSILYTMAILILHYIAYGTDRMSYIPIFSVITTYIMWYYCDFSVWYLTIGFSVSVILLVALNITSFTYYESSRKKEEDKEKYAFFEFIITVLVLIFNAYLVLSNTPLTYLVEEYPYLGLFYLILCLAVLLINDVAFCIAAGIVSIAYIGFFWSIFYLPKLFLHLPSLTFSWPNITWNWDLFTFTWCSIIMWISISILVLAIIISSYITLANYPKRFRAITVLFSFTLVPILLFFVKNDSLNWADWTCLIISFLITFVLFGFEANLEDDERDEGYFITRVGSLIIMGYLLYLCHSLKADFPIDYRYLCMVICISSMYNIVNLPYCIGFWIISIIYYTISFCDFHFSLPNISFDLSWNWDLFAFTWCSVIMWIGILLSLTALCYVLYLILHHRKMNNAKLSSDSKSFYCPIIPTALEAALIAEHVYGKTSDNTLVGGWKPCSDFNKEIITVDFISGLVSRVYKKTEKDNICTGYIYAYAGTKGGHFSVQDWSNNIAQTSGWAPQYLFANINSRKLKSLIKRKDTLTFVGHSLGGGLAALSAMSNKDTSAITFNAAGVSLHTQKMYNAYDESHITAYIAEEDPLHYFQKNADKLQGDIYLKLSKYLSDIRPANGKKIFKCTYRFGLDGHSISSLIKALREQ